jgi:membrane-associated phospholipid phosphatase
MHIVAANQHTANDPRRSLAACISLALFFITVLLLVVFVPAMSSLDSLLSQSLQSLRSPMLDRLMLGITMTADFVVTTAVVVGLCALLLFARRWWLAIHLACVYAAAKLGVVVFKLLIARARPELSEGALEFFSFPSGHACAAAVVTGVVSAMIAYRKPVGIRNLVYGLGILVTLLVCVSRVYLLAHWPTDVIAGSVFGYTLVIAFAWQLRKGDLLEIKYLTPMLLMLCVLSIGSYAFYSFSGQLAHYGLSV